MQEMRNLNCSSVEAGGILVFSLAILKTCSTARSKRVKKAVGRLRVFKLNVGEVCRCFG